VELAKVGLEQPNLRGAVSPRALPARAGAGR